MFAVATSVLATQFGRNAVTRMSTPMSRAGLVRIKSHYVLIVFALTGSLPFWFLRKTWHRIFGGGVVRPNAWPETGDAQGVRAVATRHAQIRRL